MQQSAEAKDSHCQGEVGVRAGQKLTKSLQQTCKAPKGGTVVEKKPGSVRTRPGLVGQGVPLRTEG